MPDTFSLSQFPFTALLERKEVPCCVVWDVGLPWPVFYIKLIIEHSHNHSLQLYRRCMHRVIKNDLQGLVISDNYEYRKTWNVLHAKSAASVSSSIWEYLRSASDSALLAYCTTPQWSSLGLKVAEIPRGQPSTCTSWSVAGSKYAKTVSALRAFFKASNASWCFSSHLKTLALTSALRTSVYGA